jgi:hypothetical protein
VVCPQKGSSAFTVWVPSCKIEQDVVEDPSRIPPTCDCSSSGDLSQTPLVGSRTHKGHKPSAYHRKHLIFNMPLATSGEAFRKLW